MMTTGRSASTPTGCTMKQSPTNGDGRPDLRGGRLRYRPYVLRVSAEEPLRRPPAAFQVTPPTGPVGPCRNQKTPRIGTENLMTASRCELTTETHRLVGTLPCESRFARSSRNALHLGRLDAPSTDGRKFVRMGGVVQNPPP